MAYIHHLLMQQIPEFIRTNYPTFCTFVDYYYRWLATCGFNDLESITNIDYVNHVIDLTDITKRLYIKYPVNSKGEFSNGDVVRIRNFLTDSGQIVLGRVFATYKENDKTYISLLGYDVTNLHGNYVSITDINLSTDDLEGLTIQKAKIDASIDEDYDYGYIRNDRNRTSNRAEYKDYGLLSNIGNNDDRTPYQDNGLLSDEEIIPKNKIEYEEIFGTICAEESLNLVGFYLVGENGARAYVVSQDDNGRYIIRYSTVDKKFVPGEQVYVENGASLKPINPPTDGDFDYSLYTDTANVAGVYTVPSVFMDHFIKMLDNDNIFDKNNESIALILKNIRSLYLSKGTEESINFILKATFNADSTITHPWERVLKPSDGKWGQKYAVQVRTLKDSDGEDMGKFPDLLDENGNSKIYEMNFQIMDSVDGSSRTVEFDTKNVETFEKYPNIYRIYFDYDPHTYLKDSAGNTQKVTITFENEDGETEVLWKGEVVPIPTGLEILNDENGNPYSGCRWQEGQLIVSGGSQAGTFAVSDSYDTVQNPYWVRHGESAAYGYLYNIVIEDLANLDDENTRDIIDDTVVEKALVINDVKIDTVIIKGEVFNDIFFYRLGGSDVYKVYINGTSENGKTPEELISVDELESDDEESQLAKTVSISYSYVRTITDVVDGQETNVERIPMEDQITSGKIISSFGDYGIASVKTETTEKINPLVAKVSSIEDVTDALVVDLKERYSKTDSDILNMNTVSRGVHHLDLVQLGDYIDPNDTETSFVSSPLFTDHDIWFMAVEDSTLSPEKMVGKTVYNDDGAYATILFADRKNTYGIHYITADRQFYEGDLLHVSHSNDDHMVVGLIRDSSFLNVRYKYTFGSSVLMESGWADDSSQLDNEYIRLQDSNYYQQFSYDVVSTVDPKRYEQLIDFMHPAGSKRFTTYIIQEDLSLKSRLNFNVRFDSIALSFFDIAYVVDSIIDEYGNVIDAIAKKISKTFSEHLYAYDDRVVDDYGFIHDALIKYFIKVLVDEAIVTDTEIFKKFDKVLDIDYVHPTDEELSKVFQLVLKDAKGENVLIDMSEPFLDYMKTLSDEFLVNDDKVIKDVAQKLLDQVFANENLVTKRISLENGGFNEVVRTFMNNDLVSNKIRRSDLTYDAVSDYEEMYPIDGFMERSYILTVKDFGINNSYQAINYFYILTIANTGASQGI